VHLVMTQTSFASLQSPAGATSSPLTSGTNQELLALGRLRYELDLPANERRRHVIDRLRSWLDLDREDARSVAAAFEVCKRQLDPEEQKESEATEEDAVMDGLSYAEFQSLAEFVPSLQKWQAQLPVEAEPKGFLSSLFAALAMANSGWDY